MRVIARRDGPVHIVFTRRTPPADPAPADLTFTTDSATTHPGGTVNLSMTMTNNRTYDVWFLYQTIDPTWLTTQRPEQGRRVHRETEHGLPRLHGCLRAVQDPPHAYDFDGYWLDIGRPDDYDRANAEHLATARTDGLAKTLASAAPDAVINCAGSTDGDAVTLSSTVCPRRSYRSPCAPRANAARRSAVT